MQVQQSRDVLRFPGLSCRSVPIPGGQLSILMLVTSWLPGNCWCSVLTTESQGKKKWGEGPCIREGTAFPRRSVLTHLRKPGRLSPHTKLGLAPLLRKNGMKEVGDQRHLLQRAFQMCQH